MTLRVNHSQVRIPRSIGLGFLLLALLSSCQQGSVALADGWRRVDFESDDLTAPFVSIDYTGEGSRLNGVPLNNARVVEEMRKQSRLVPQPLVFLRFSRENVDGARVLANEIRNTGACSGGGCMFKVVER